LKAAEGIWKDEIHLTPTIHQVFFDHLIRDVMNMTVDPFLGMGNRVAMIF